MSKCLQMMPNFARTGFCYKSKGLDQGSPVQNSYASLVTPQRPSQRDRGTWARLKSFRGSRHGELQRRVTRRSEEKKEPRENPQKSRCRATVRRKSSARGEGGSRERGTPPVRTPARQPRQVRTVACRTIAPAVAVPSSGVKGMQKRDGWVPHEGRLRARTLRSAGRRLQDSPALRAGGPAEPAGGNSCSETWPTDEAV